MGCKTPTRCARARPSGPMCRCIHSVTIGTPPPTLCKYTRLSHTRHERRFERAMYEIAKAALDVWRQHQQRLPAWNSVPALQAPMFTRLRGLVTKGGPNCLVERLVDPPPKTRNAAGKGSTRRKSAPGTSREKDATVQGRGGSEGTGAPFLARIKH